MRAILSAVAVALVAVVVVREASAHPAIENRLLFERAAIGPTANEDVEIYHDDSDASRFWWIPFELSVKAMPATGLPLIRWDLSVRPARMTTVLDVRPRSASLKAALERLIVRRYPWLDPAQIQLSAIPLEEVRSQFVFRSEGQGNVVISANEWLGRSAFLSRDIPVSVSLNERYEEIIQRVSRGMVTVLLQVSATFKAKLTASRSVAIADPRCVASALIEASVDAQNLNSLGGTDIPRIFLWAKFSQMEMDCVRNRYRSGRSPDPLQEVQSWADFLSEMGVIQDAGDSWKFGSAERLHEVFGQPEFHVHTQVPESLQGFPVLLSHIPVNKFGE